MPDPQPSSVAEEEYVVRLRIRARSDEMPRSTEVAAALLHGLHRDWFRDTYPRAGWWIEPESITVEREE